MDRKKRIHDLISKTADELVPYIKEEGSLYKDIAISKDAGAIIDGGDL